jgi:hypothetical protein
VRMRNLMLYSAFPRAKYSSTAPLYLYSFHILLLAYFSEEYARHVEDTGGVYVVPAFSGFLAPHWQPDARG